MQFLLLVYGAEANWVKMTPPARSALYQEYRQLIQELSENDKFRAGDELKPTTTATTVRIRDDKRLVTDGPFAKTEEQLGGYFLVDADDLDEAIAIAARIPSARDGSIEVRPIEPPQLANRA